MKDIIGFSDKAIKKISGLLDEDGALLRISIRGGGCAGMEYVFELIQVASMEEGDLLLANGKVVVDTISANYLQGSTLDYTTELAGERFVFKNPNAGASCGCGMSFTA